MARDAEGTRRRLLEAAADEFAQRGIAGARVDRIAAAANANKALIYSYFGNKEDLFDAVFNALVVDTVHDVSIDASDLPDYAGRLFDRNLSRPRALRLAIWHSLERGDAALPEAVIVANQDKVRAIADAQKRGQVSRTFPAGELMILITGLSIMGSSELAMTKPSDVVERRRTVTEAVRILTQGDKS